MDKWGEAVGDRDDVDPPASPPVWEEAFHHHRKILCQDGFQLSE